MSKPYIKFIIKFARFNRVIFLTEKIQSNVYLHSHCLIPNFKANRMHFVYMRRGYLKALSNTVLEFISKHVYPGPTQKLLYFVRSMSRPTLPCDSISRNIWSFSLCHDVIPSYFIKLFIEFYSCNDII